MTSTEGLAVATVRRRAPAAVRATVFTASIVLVGVGVGTMVTAQLGVAPNDVMNTGLAQALGSGVGTAAWLTAALAMGLAWALGRRPRPATVLGGVLVGLSINTSVALLPRLDALSIRLMLVAAGLAIVWLGITGVVAADVGAGPLELVMLALMDRGIGIHVARWSIEVSLLIIGLALGGAVGAGTVVFALGTGPVLAVTVPRATAFLGTDLRHPAEVAAAGT